MKTNKSVSVLGLRPKSSSKLFATVLGISAMISIPLVTIGCGGGTSTSPSSIPSNVVQNLATAISQQSSTNLTAGAAIIGRGDDRVQPAAVSCNQTSCVFSEQVNTSAACQFGGTIGVAGDVNGTLSTSGTGNINFQIDETFTNCVPVTGYTVNGAPEVTVGGTFAFNGGALSFPLQILEGGAVTINGTNCGVNLTTLVESNGSSTTTGTLCGQSVNVSTT